MPFFVFSQIEESRESKLYRFWAQQERKKVLEDSINQLYYYKNELSYYINGEKIGEYQKPTYYSMIKSIQDIVKLENNDSIRKIYYDTINIIQNIMEEKGFLDNINYKTRLSWYVKGNKQYNEKIDSIFLSEIKGGNELSSNLKAFYYSNIYFLYKKNNDTTNLYRLYDEMFKILDDSTMITNYIDRCSNIFNIVFNDSSKINVIISDFLINNKDNKQNLDFMVSHLEKNDLNNNEFYEKCLLLLTELDKTSENYFKLANFYRINDQKDRYNTVLSEIKQLFPKYIDEINYNECVNLFYNKNYIGAYNLSLKINGKYKGESLKIAGMSVALLANKSGISTFERKCNYYYAIELLNKSKLYGTDVSNLISQYKNYLPTNQQKFEEGNPKTINLSTWGVIINIY